MKVAFSELTARSHITDGPGLDLQFDISIQEMRKLDALMKGHFVFNAPTDFVLSYYKSVGNKSSIFEAVAEKKMFTH